MSGEHLPGTATEDLEALFDSIAAARPTAAASASEPDVLPSDLISRIGNMARKLNDGLNDRTLAAAAESIPNVRDRLAYVATMTEKAAEQALYAAESAMPIQEKLASDADALASRWDELLTAQPGVDEFKALVASTREFLRLVPGQARATNAQLTEVMLAQGFQDLTGQVIGKVSDVVLELEGELAALLVESTGRAKPDQSGGRMEGPVIDRAARTELVTGQRQVDELLESLAS